MAENDEQPRRGSQGPPLDVRVGSSSGGLGTPIFDAATGLPMTPIGSLVVSELPIFDTWIRWPSLCDVAALTRKQRYSRGNNDPGEMTAQKAKTGTTYQYQTATFDLDVSTFPVCWCGRGNECWGFIGIGVKLEIDLPGAFTALGWNLLDGVDLATPTTPVAGGTPPSPDVDVTLEQVDLPARRPPNGFTQPDATKKRYVAQAFGSVPCRVGTHAKRFFIVRNALAGKAGHRPGGGLTVFVDVVLTLTEKDGCGLDSELAVYLLEFHPSFDFTHGGTCPGADAELPEIHSTLVGGGTASSHNIAKLVEQDGNPVDAPFVPK